MAVTHSLEEGWVVRHLCLRGRGMAWDGAGVLESRTAQSHFLDWSASPALRRGLHAEVVMRSGMGQLPFREGHIVFLQQRIEARTRDAGDLAGSLDIAICLRNQSAKVGFVRDLPLVFEGW